MFSCSFKYQSLPDLVSRVKEVYHQFCILSKQHDCIKKNIAATGEQAGVVVNEETHADLVAITSDSAH